MTQQCYSVRPGFPTSSDSRISHRKPDKSIPRIKSVLALLCLSLVSFSAMADWQVLDSGTGKNLFAVDFPMDASTGYVVGQSGIILKTGDGGKSWRKSRSKTRAHLFDVDFVSNDVGFAVGASGTVVKTVNAGKRWTKLTAGTSQHLKAVYFIDENTGYVGGASRTLLKTTDGGKSWSSQFISDGWVRDIVFPGDGKTGYVSTIAGTLGYIFKTVDGGQHWEKVLYMEDADLSSMSFPLDDQVGYVTNRDTYYQHGVWKTIDGGANWSFVTTGHKAVMHAVTFPMDENIGTAVGSKGAVMTTHDGGSSWTEGSAGVATTLSDVHFVSNDVGYAVGGSGIIVKTEDKGTPSLLSVYMHPQSSGSENSFTMQVGCDTDWDCVNDQAGNAATGLPVTPDSGNYVADESGNRVMFALADNVIAADKRVTEICVFIAATQYNGPYASLGYQRMGYDPEPVDSPVFWIGSYWYNDLSQYCWKDLDWSSQQLDSLEIEARSVTGQLLRVSQLFVKVTYK